jgi:hypothetical protein
MKTTKHKEQKMFENAEIISTYTAAEAEADGFLINVTEMAKEAGFKRTTRISRTVHELCTPPKSNKIQSYEGRLWDVLCLARLLAIGRNEASDNLVAYKVKIGRKIETLWITIDETMGEPAIHIITPSDY